MSTSVPIRGSYVWDALTRGRRSLVDRFLEKFLSESELPSKGSAEECWYKYLHFEFQLTKSCRSHCCKHTIKFEFAGK